MPSPTTAIELITGAMKVVGIIAAGSGDTPTADESTDGLDALNDLLETMSLDNLFVYSAANETFTFAAGQATRTIGPTGQFVTTRPVRISGAYCTYQGVDFPIQIIGQGEYDDISLKTMSQPIVERMLYVNDFPNGILSFWPVPSQAIPLVLSTDRVMTVIPTIATSISLPPGYLNFMKHALGIMLAPDYGVTPSEDVVGIARSTRAALKRANKQKYRARFDCSLQDGGGYVDWRTGV